MFLFQIFLICRLIFILLNDDALVIGAAKHLPQVPLLYIPPVNQHSNVFKNILGQFLTEIACVNENIGRYLLQLRQQFPQGIRLKEGVATCDGEAIHRMLPADELDQRHHLRQFRSILFSLLP